jgi:hypothetical protein
LELLDEAQKPVFRIRLVAETLKAAPVSGHSQCGQGSTSVALI